MDDFRRFLLDWLERRGWSQARLAEATEISQALISKHLMEDERRRVRPSPANLAKYAPVLGVSYEDLMRMNGYLPGSVEIAEASGIEEDVRARSAELLTAVRGAPPIFWETMISSTFRMANEYARNMAKMLANAESEVSADRAASPPSNRAPTDSSNGGFRRRQRPIKPRHLPLEDRALATV